MKQFISIFLSSPLVALAADTNVLPTLVPPYGEIPLTFWDQHKFAILIGGFFLISLQSLFLWKMFMRLQPKVEPVENLTRAALTSLLNEPEDGKLLSEVSRILRSYFGRQFQMTGEEATTEEFVAALEQNQQLDAGLTTRVATFLRECDARKFSPAAGTSEIDAAERALDLVDEAEKFRAGHNTSA